MATSIKGTFDGKAERLPHLTAEIQGLKTDVDVLSGRIECLAVRLAPVLRTAEGPSEAPVASLIPSTCPAAEDLAQARRRLADLGAILDDILRRLEA